LGYCLLDIGRASNILSQSYYNYTMLYCNYIEGVSGRIVNILGGGSMDYSE